MSRKVNKTLKLVANSEHYFPNDWEFEKFPHLMCCSLEHAKRSGLIRKKEKDLATKAIAKYLRKLCKCIGYPYFQHSTTLEDALYYNKLPSTFEDRKIIYLDWANRPKPWKVN